MTALGVLLSVIFVILKATDSVSWGWLAICLPAIIGIGLDVLIGIVSAAVTASAAASISREFRTASRRARR